MNVSRRTLLRGVTLGAGATVLSSISDQILREAHGQERKFKRLVIVLGGNGMAWENFSPGGYKPEDLKAKNISNATHIDTQTFDLANTYKSLAPFRNRMLLVDGLPNRNGGGHSSSYAALSCQRNVGDAQLGAPGGITFDQFMARRIAGTTPFKSVVLGVAPNPTTVAYVGSSASGRMMPVAIRAQPTAAVGAIFGMVKGGTTSEAALEANFAKRDGVMSFLREDVARLKAQVAAPERVKFDQYVNALEGLEERFKVIQTASLPATCKVPTGMTDAATIDGRMAQQFELGKSVLSCGLTNVLTMCFGTGMFWNLGDNKFLGLQAGLHGIGHGAFGGTNAMDGIHDWVAGQIAGLAKHLDSFREGNGTMLDNTLIVFMNENGEAHHGRYYRWPTLILGGGSVLKADGRYVRFPVRALKDATEHSMSGLFNTLAYALGHPTDDFGKAGAEPVNGPLAALMR